MQVRINKLFKILEHRFQSDVTVWLSHIAFLKEAQWETSVSRIYLRMLQVCRYDAPGEHYLPSALFTWCTCCTWLNWCQWCS
jgi:hypothetical protein